MADACARAATAAGYERNRPEEMVLYSALQAHWKTFISELEAAAESPVLSAFVVAEVEAFLRCGILSQGLILAKMSGLGVVPPRANGDYAPSGLASRTPSA
jgi:hypothetical protein